MHTCRYRGSECRASAGSSPRFCSSLRRAVQRCTAGGGGCAASKSACLRRTHAATSVEMRSNLLGAKAPPKLTRWSTMTPALPRESHQTKHCTHQSARCTGQNRYADSASATHATALARVSPGATSSPLVSTTASALASCCTRGSTTVRSAAGTPAFTPSRPP
eukprot:5895973-Pleurochrysis_carterae.AAC.1